MIFGLKVKYSNIKQTNNTLCIPSFSKNQTSQLPIGEIKPDDQNTYLVKLQSQYFTLFSENEGRRSPMASEVCSRV